MAGTHTTARPTLPVPRSAPAEDPGVSAGELLDALPDATALLDATGTVTAVNRAWRAFAQDNGGDPAATGRGVSYVEVCRRSAAAGCADAAAVLEGLDAVLRGATVEAVLEYPCPSPAVGRWYSLRITPLPGGAGAVVSHTNVTRQKTAELDLERRASQDPLTGLANRARFDRRLASCLGSRRGQVGVLYLDLDGFKPVNDTFGHAAGDEVLQTVGARLQAVVRARDLVARLGGDEFAVVASGVDAAALAGLAGRVEQALDAPHLVHGQQVRVGASVGTFLARPGEEPAAALARADAAMYARKQHRRGG